MGLKLLTFFCARELKEIIRKQNLMTKRLSSSRSWGQPAWLAGQNFFGDTRFDEIKAVKCLTVRFRILNLKSQSLQLGSEF